MGNRKRRSFLLAITVTTVLPLLPPPVSLGAQEQPTQEGGWWGGLALGGTGEHFSTLLMAGTRTGHRLLSARWNTHLDGSAIFFGPADFDYVSELGVLYGFQAAYKWFDIAVSGGPGWVLKTTRPGAHSDTRTRTESSVGLMLGAEATLALGRSFAIGVQGYGGLSSVETIWGVGWVFKFGRLR